VSPNSPRHVKLVANPRGTPCTPACTKYEIEITDKRRGYAPEYARLLNALGRIFDTFISAVVNVSAKIAIISENKTLRIERSRETDRGR